MEENVNEIKKFESGDFVSRFHPVAKIAAPISGVALGLALGAFVCIPLTLIPMVGWILGGLGFVLCVMLSFLLGIASLAMGIIMKVALSKLSENPEKEEDAKMISFVRTVSTLAIIFGAISIVLL